MGWIPFWDGMLAGYGIAIPVGAIAVLILDTGLRRGFRTGFFAGAGAASADTIYACVAVAAGAALGPLLQPYALPMGLASAGFLLAFGGRGVWRARRSLSAVAPARPDPGSDLGTFAQFLGLTLLNPLTIAYFAALILGSKAITGWSAFDGLLFVAGAGLASLSWQSLLAGTGVVVGRKLPVSLQLATSLVGNLVVLALGLRILVTAVLGG
jgi:arginine exporter protein ArgO